MLQGSWEAPGLALCPAFTRLSALEFHCVGALPPCLGDMTGLQRLAVVSSGRSGCATQRQCQLLCT